jgi:predicted NBD/HSP70 family sugar kinase
VLGGQLYRGRRGFSGEVGHLPVRPSGPTCSCGAQGCLEQVAGQEWILRRAGMPATVSTLTGRPEGSVDELARRARDGDRKALTAVASAGRSLGIGVAALVNLLDVDTVVLGGLYAVLAPWLREPVENELVMRVLATPWAPVSVLVSGLGGEAAVRGAATSVLRDVLSDPAAYLAGRAG